MVVTMPTGLSPEAIDGLIDEWIAQDPFQPGRHNAVFRGGRTHLWAVLAHLEEDHGNLATVASMYLLPEEAVVAAIAYRERNQALFDADQLLRDEEWAS